MKYSKYAQNKHHHTAEERMGQVPSGTLIMKSVILIANS